MLSSLAIHDLGAKGTREKPSKHDALHNNHYCWCMNKCCWYQWWHKRNDGTKVLLGICICPECPCNSPRFLVVRSAS